MSQPSTTEIDYVLGTGDEELERLGLQHRVWRSRASDAWRRAGFTQGQTILDIGSGPGYASLDFAEIVGATGQVLALERSVRFIAALEAVAASRHIRNIETHQIDLDTDAFPIVQADAAWVRWVFAFVTKPRDLVQRIANSLKPGGVLVLHEYFDYGTWRYVNRSPKHREYVEAVMRAWRDDGGEPDIALDLLGWIEEAGMTIESTKTIVDVISPTDYAWQWPKTFIDIGLRRLVSIGQLSQERADGIRADFAEYERSAHPRIVTPAVLEIIARK